MWNPFYMNIKITNNINNFTITNFKEYKLNKNKLNDNHSKNSYIKRKVWWFGNKDLLDINFELKKISYKM